MIFCLQSSSHSFKSEVAIDEISVGKLSFGGARFIPIPSIAYSSVWLTVDNDASVKIPQTFLPFRKISFTHLIWGSNDNVFSIARQTATAAAVVISKDLFGYNLGRRIMLI